MIIKVESGATTVTIEPHGYIRQVLETAETPEDRAKLERHIADRYAAVERDLIKFSLGNDEAIDYILHPEEHVGPE
jgi:hypothetical protein